MTDPIATLTRAMKAARLSRVQLARAAGVSRCGLSRILSGKQDPRLSVYLRLLAVARGAKGRGLPANPAPLPQDAIRHQMGTSGGPWDGTP